MYDRELIDDLLRATDIVDVVRHYLHDGVIKKGKNYAAVCPFHDDHDPSLSINTDLQIYKCFVCGHGGNAIRFVQEYEKCSFPEAVRKTAEISGFHDPRLLAALPNVNIDPEKKKLYDCINDLQDFYRYMLSTSEGANARAYLEKRAIAQEAIEKYGVGYAPLDGEKTVAFLESKGHSLKTIEDIGVGVPTATGMKDRNAGRVTFPLRNARGQVVGFSARQLIKDPNSGKYVNSPETMIFHKGSLLYNYHNVLETARREGYCYVLEGFMDVIALDRAGIANAVALMGTAMTGEHTDMLRKLGCEIRLCLDGDNAGQMGMMKALRLLTRARVPYRVVDYAGDRRDPDDLLREEGEEALRNRMGRLVDGLDFQLDYYINVKKLTRPEEKKAVASHFVPLFKAEDEWTRENHIAKLAKALNFEESVLRMMVAKASSVKEDAEEEAISFRKEETVRPSAPMVSRLTKRLAVAEDAILYYALHDEKAREYLEKFGNPVYSSVQRKVIYFILDYARNADCFDLAGLMSYIDATEEEDGAACADVLADIAGQGKGKLPYSPDILADCAKAIEEEKGVAVEDMRVQRAFASGDQSAAAAALNARAKKRQAAWAKRKEKKSA